MFMPTKAEITPFGESTDITNQQAPYPSFCPISRFTWMGRSSLSPFLLIRFSMVA